MKIIAGLLFLFVILTLFAIQWNDQWNKLEQYRIKVWQLEEQIRIMELPPAELNLGEIYFNSDLPVTDNKTY